MFFLDIQNGRQYDANGQNDDNEWLGNIMESSKKRPRKTQDSLSNFSGKLDSSDTGTRGKSSSSKRSRYQIEAKDADTSRGMFMNPNAVDLTTERATNRMNITMRTPNSPSHEVS